MPLDRRIDFSDEEPEDDFEESEDEEIAQDEEFWERAVQRYLHMSSENQEKFEKTLSEAQYNELQRRVDLHSEDHLR